MALAIISIGLPLVQYVSILSAFGTRYFDYDPSRIFNMMDVFPLCSELMCAYKVRQLLNMYSADNKTYLDVANLPTFLFGIYYLQYKRNRFPGTGGEPKPAREEQAIEE